MNEIKVLDQGYVRYVDHLGSDEAIVRAARTSMGRGFISWDPYRRCTRKGCDYVDHFGIKQKRTGVHGFTDLSYCEAAGDRLAAHQWQDHPKGDGQLLDFMMRLGHTSPFEMCELVIDVKVPMDTWRQWIRHRTANVNEYSTRYAEAIDEMAATLPGEWRTQSKTNRQGSGGFLPIGTSDPGPTREGGSGGALLSQHETDLHRHARDVYEERLRAGIAKEQARKDLPLSNYTAATWKCDLHNIFHFLGKRLDPAAQLEIQLYAQAVASIVKEIWPRSYALWEEYKLYGVHLSRTEAAKLVGLLGAWRRDAAGLSEAEINLLKKLGAA